MPAPEPRNRPAPIALPRPIITSWREVRDCPRAGAGEEVADMKSRAGGKLPTLAGLAV